MDNTWRYDLRDVDMLLIGVRDPSPDPKATRPQGHQTARLLGPRITTAYHRSPRPDTTAHHGSIPLLTQHLNYPPQDKQVVGTTRDGRIPAGTHALITNATTTNTMTAFLTFQHTMKPI